MKRLIAMVVTVVLVLSLMACGQTTQTTPKQADTKTEAVATTAKDESKTQPTDAGGVKYKDFKKDGKIKIAFVCKFLSSVWFGPKSEAMAEESKALGVEYLPMDANNKEDQCLQAIDNAISKDVDGIILTAVNQSLVSPIAKKCHESGVALMTTDDPGVDENGKPIPHVGLDDYALGAASAKKMVAAAEQRGFLKDPSKLKIAVMDVPRVEGFHKRLLGGMDAIKEKFPNIPQDAYIVVDVKDGLVDNVLAQFTNVFQANKKVENWIILGGDEGALTGTYPILKENNVDFKKVLWSTIAGSTQVIDHMANSADVANATFFSGILSKPSGKVCIDTMYNFLEKGIELPKFTGYTENVCDVSNYKDNFLVFLTKK